MEKKLNDLMVCLQELHSSLGSSPAIRNLLKSLRYSIVYSAREDLILAQLYFIREADAKVFKSIVDKLLDKSPDFECADPFLNELKRQMRLLSVQPSSKPADSEKAFKAYCENDVYFTKRAQMILNNSPPVRQPNIMIACLESLKRCLHRVRAEASGMSVAGEASFHSLMFCINTSIENPRYTDVVARLDNLARFEPKFVADVASYVLREESGYYNKDLLFTYLRHALETQKIKQPQPKPLDKDLKMTSTSNRFFTMYGDTFMKVTPVDALMRSKTTTSAIRRGDQYAVNMETGMLTIITKAKMDAYYAARTVTVSLKLSDDTVHVLPADDETNFVLKLDELFGSRNLNGALLYSEEAVTPVGFPSSKSYDTFVQEARSFVRAVKVRVRQRNQ